MPTNFSMSETPKPRVQRRKKRVDKKNSNTAASTMRRAAVAFLTTTLIGVVSFMIMTVAVNAQSRLESGESLADALSNGARQSVRDVRHMLRNEPRDSREDHLRIAVNTMHLRADSRRDALPNANAVALSRMRSLAAESEVGRGVIEGFSADRKRSRRALRSVDDSGQQRSDGGSGQGVAGDSFVRRAREWLSSMLGRGGGGGGAGGGQPARRRSPEDNNNNIDASTAKALEFVARELSASVRDLERSVVSYRGKQLVHADCSPELELAKLKAQVSRAATVFKLVRDTEEMSLQAVRRFSEENRDRTGAAVHAFFSRYSDHRTINAVFAQARQVIIDVSRTVELRALGHVVSSLEAAPNFEGDSFEKV